MLSKKTNKERLTEEAKKALWQYTFSKEKQYLDKYNAIVEHLKELEDAEKENATKEFLQAEDKR